MFKIRVSKFKLAIWRLLQVFEILKLKCSVKQTCHLGTLLEGTPGKSAAIERVAFSQEEFAFFWVPFVFEFLHSESDFFERSKLKVWLAPTLGLKVVKKTGFEVQTQEIGMGKLRNEVLRS